MEAKYVSKSSVDYQRTTQCYVSAQENIFQRPAFIYVLQLRNYLQLNSPQFLDCRQFVHENNNSSWNSPILHSLLFCVMTYGALQRSMLPLHSASSM